MRTIAIAMALIALAAAVGIAQPPPNGSAQQGLALGVDADPTGNTATSLTGIDQCVSVQRGQTFSVDVFITDVTDLLAWEAYFSFDGSVVNVIDRDVKLFQAANADSDVFDASESLPSGGGLYRLGAIDFGQPPSPDTGSGVLARLTLEAVGAGLSPAILTTIDANNDGRPDLGPILKDPDETPLGDSNGDGFFDGPILNAQIAVDRGCPPAVATPTPTPVSSPTSSSPTPGGETTPALSPTVTRTPSRTPTASAGPRETATAPPNTASPTATAPTSSDNDGGSDWASPFLIAVYVAAGTLGALAVGALALMGVRRRRL